MAKSDVYLIFDRYSIKGWTRLARIGSAKHTHNLSLSTPLPMGELALSSQKTKVQLIELIAIELLEEFTTKPCKQKLICTTQNTCPLQIVEGVQTTRNDLRTTHEEADVIIPQQVIFSIEECASTIKVVCDDTDVFVLLTYFYREKGLTANVFLEATGSTKSVIDIGKTVDCHKDIIPSLLAGHALTGCDSVPKYFGIGKVKVCSLLKHYPLTHLGNIGAGMDLVFQESEIFIAACYGIKSAPSMSQVRYVYCSFINIS